jgi:hypothetical protein
MQVRRYEKERVENASTYWLLFELIWRDYFRFISIKFGDKLFKLGGLRDVSAYVKWDRMLMDPHLLLTGGCLIVKSSSTDAFCGIKFVHERSSNLDWSPCIRT